MLQEMISTQSFDSKNVENLRMPCNTPNQSNDGNPCDGKHNECDRGAVNHLEYQLLECGSDLTTTLCIMKSHLLNNIDLFNLIVFMLQIIQIIH